MVDKYLDEMWLPLMLSVMGLQPLPLNEKMQRRFKEYVDAEEQRLKRNLETVRYRIDDLTTLSIVTGPGQIEKVWRSLRMPSGTDVLRPCQHLFPLVYLMLHRDLQVLRACQNNIVAEGELWDSFDNILNVTIACRNRKEALRGEKLRSAPCGTPYALTNTF